MADQETARKILEEIRDPTRLGHLRRRPRCADGSLDMRYKVNRGLSKLEMAAEFYDPAHPAVLVEEAVVRQLRANQQKRMTRRFSGSSWRGWRSWSRRDQPS